MNVQRCLACHEPVDPRRRPLVLERTGDVVCNPCARHARLGKDWLFPIDVAAWLYRVTKGLPR